jgi:phosphoribosylanthranilate isomerase
MILSGGLTADNVATAIAAVRPFAVDVASGVERSPGIKDPAALDAFAQAVRDTAPVEATRTRTR